MVCSDGTYFGSSTAQVNLATYNAADTYGVYAATEGGKLSIVIVNKDTKPLALDLSNVPPGSYFFRHFGGASGVAKWKVGSFISYLSRSINPDISCRLRSLFRRLSIS